MHGRQQDPETKVLARDAVVRRTRDASMRPLVFTNGCFDVLHRGHVAYLSRARTLGATLLVGVNSDASVRRLKGPGRPLVSAEDRAYVLAGLAAVDLVTVFDEDTPLELIRAVRPDVLVKGGDYAEDQVVGREVVDAGGGRVVILPFVEGRSTSGLIRRMREER
jgi:rfaE bifunctional protein nucleotidyltransferase chain/domain